MITVPQLANKLAEFHGNRSFIALLTTTGHWTLQSEPQNLTTEPLYPKENIAKYTLMTE
jgi:hypothetical protein